ncbi:Hypothetical predicted protein [Lecanosticta acicola]|uniref:Uncharacterized protein n=1 Tax=Lecanosticta acicola TaxID=111012 RepID=A0AAI8Z544_9PEZI|nr:Hypothetical predicted protein [Lecanosticta acicola]
MRHTAGIEVKIRPCGEAEYLEEYKNPDAGIPDHWIDTIGSTLISGPPQQRLQICVIIEEHFKMYAARALAVAIQLPSMEEPQVWVIQVGDRDPTGTYEFSSILRWTEDGVGPAITPLELPEPDPNINVPPLGDTWDDGEESPPSKGCIVIEINRVRGKHSLGDSTVARPKEFSPARWTNFQSLVPIVVDREWLKGLRSENYFALLGEFRNIDREKFEHELIIAKDPIDLAEKDAVIDDEADDSEKEDFDNEEDYDYQDDHYEKNSSEEEELDDSAASSQASPSPTRYIPNPGLVVLHLPGHLLAKLCRRTTVARVPSKPNMQQTGRHDRDDNRDPNIVNVKKETAMIDLTTSDDNKETQPMAANIKKRSPIVEDSAVRDRKRSNYETATSRSPAEIKKRKKEKEKCRLQLEEIRAQRQLLEFSSDDDGE